MNDKLHILQHALGVGDFGDERSYRNHYCTGPGGNSYECCVELVASGLMTRRAGSAITGGDDVFYVTATGRTYVTQHSPARPKLTRSQANYEAFLSADCGYSFREWLGAKPKSRSHA